MELFPAQRRVTKLDLRIVFWGDDCGSEHDHIKLYIAADYGKLERNTTALAVYVHSVLSLQANIPPTYYFITKEESRQQRMVTSVFVGLPVQLCYTDMVKGKLAESSRQKLRGKAYILTKHHIVVARAEVGCCYSVIWRDEWKRSRETAWYTIFHFINIFQEVRIYVLIYWIVVICVVS
jgi:hypothetical protein